METSSWPILHHLLSQLESLKTKLHFISNGIAQGSPPVCPDEITRSLATQVLENIESIRVHVLWIVSCILNPVFRIFSFLTSSVNVDEWKSIGYSMIRRMMSTYSTDKKSAESSQMHINNAPIASLKSYELFLKSAMSFLDSSKKSFDELQSYLSEASYGCKNKRWWYCWLLANRIDWISEPSNSWSTSICLLHLLLNLKLNVNSVTSSGWWDLIERHWQKQLYQILLVLESTLK